MTVNEILGSHNVDKQFSDSRGDVAYLMADVSNVQANDIREIHDSLEVLSCKLSPCGVGSKSVDVWLTWDSAHSGSNSLLENEL